MVEQSFVRETLEMLEYPWVKYEVENGDYVEKVRYLPIFYCVSGVEQRHPLSYKYLFIRGFLHKMSF